MLIYELFVNLKTDYFVFQDQLYNPELRNGLLFQKFRYESRKNIETKNREAMDDEPDQITITELTTFFQACVLPDDKPNLVKTLQESAEMRKIWLHKKQRAIVESSLKLFIVCPELVKLVKHFDIYGTFAVIIINIISNIRY